ncbi:uncharacterized protein [Nicotiana tomentosiformis]|uniref:uncharacterized protein n=1 Tax=Nicotiana tomentosiformis TaxID=4098 RepID=UPI00388C5EEF
MTVTQYETRFVDLARYVIILIPTEREKVRRFIDGLTYTIRLQMANETESDISFQTAVDIARRIEMVPTQERGSVSNKRPLHSDSFNGASSGDRAYSTPPAPVSAPLIQSYQSGYPGRQGQFQGQQSQQSRTCYSCGHPRHIARLCPRSQGSIQQQSSRAMIPALVAPPPAQPARGKGQAAIGGGQAVRGRGQLARDHPKDIPKGSGEFRTHFEEFIGDQIFAGAQISHLREISRICKLHARICEENGGLKSSHL